MSRAPTRATCDNYPATLNGRAEPGRGHDTQPADRHIQVIRDKERLSWQKAVSDGRRSHAETAMFRYKAIVGSGFRARTLSAQKTEIKIGCSVLNRMAESGMPASQQVA